MTSSPWIPDDVPDWFWTLIDDAHGDADVLRRRAAELPMQQLRAAVHYATELASFVKRSDLDDDDEAGDLADWIVTRGQKFYFDVYEEMIPAPDALPAEDVEPAVGVLLGAYMDRAGLGVWDRNAPPADTVHRGKYFLDERLRGGASDEVWLGHVAATPEERVLATLTLAHPPDALARVSREEPVLYVGPGDPGGPFTDALVERIPPGRAIAELALRSDAEVLAVGRALAAQVAAAHARGVTLGGIYPELVYVTDGDAPEVGLCPNGPGFIASAPARGGARSYRVPYLPYEVLVLGQPPAPPADVFAACATLYYLGTGAHPFGDAADLRALLARLGTGAPDAWPGNPALGAVLASGLTRDPAARPTAAALVAALARL